MNRRLQALLDRQRSAESSGRPPRLAESLFDVPLLMAPGEPLEQMRAFAQALRVDPLDARAFFDFWDTGPSADQPQDGIAVITVRGSLYRGMFWDDYTRLQVAIEDALRDPGVRGVLLDIDSPGGRVGGCFELSSWIAAQRDRKPIWSLANDQATSAAYALAGAAERVFASPSAVVGSIGVIAMHMDISEANKAEGIKVTEIASGARKTDLSPYKPLSDRGRATLERVVGAAADQFFAEIAAYRPQLSEQALRAMDAGIYVGAEGIDAGLVDAIAMREDVLEQMRAELATSPMRVPRSQTLATPAAEGGTSMPGQTDPAATQTAAATTTPPAAAAAAPATTPVAPTAPAAAAPPPPAQDLAAAAAAALQSQARQIVNICTIAGAPELAGSFIAEGATLEQVQAKLLARRASADTEAVNGNHNSAQPAQVNIDRSELYARWSDPKRFSAGKARA